MALTADSMAGRVMNYISAVPAHDQGSTANLYAYRYQIIKAICQGIIDEIHQNIEITACQQYPEVKIGPEVVDVVSPSGP